MKRSRKRPAKRDVRGLELLNNAILNNGRGISKHTCCLPVQLPRSHKHDEFIYGVACKIGGQFLEQLKGEANAPQGNPGFIWTQSVGQSQIVCVVCVETMLAGIKPEQSQPYEGICRCAGQRCASRVIKRIIRRLDECLIGRRNRFVHDEEAQSYKTAQHRRITKWLSVSI